MEVIASAPKPYTSAVTFEFRNMTSELFNFVRHAVFKDDAILAVDTITFGAYDGSMESEMVSSRIGQLPIRGDGDTATFSLSVHASTDKSSLTWVTSTDIVCTSGNAKIVHYRTPEEKALAAHDSGFLLIPLHPGQQANMTFVARRSTAREATRWVSCHTKATMETRTMTIENTGALDAVEALKSALRRSLERLQLLAHNIHGEST